jgi:hypothetical protein
MQQAQLKSLHRVFESPECPPSSTDMLPRMKPEDDTRGLLLSRRSGVPSGSSLMSEGLTTESKLLKDSRKL